MIKLLFRPFSILAGVLAGLTSKKTFDFLWRRIDRRPPPRPDEREASTAKLAAALLLEGAVFRVVKGLIDHGARRSFLRLTGRWPGEKRAKPDS
jgi:hypothetical protein